MSTPPPGTPRAATTPRIIARASVMGAAMSLSSSGPPSASSSARSRLARPHAASAVRSAPRGSRSRSRPAATSSPPARISTDGRARPDARADQLQRRLRGRLGIGAVRAGARCCAGTSATDPGDRCARAAPAPPRRSSPMRRAVGGARRSSSTSLLRERPLAAARSPEAIQADQHRARRARPARSAPPASPARGSGRRRRWRCASAPQRDRRARWPARASRSAPRSPPPPARPGADRAAPRPEMRHAAAGRDAPASAATPTRASMRDRTRLRRSGFWFLDVGM